MERRESTICGNAALANELFAKVIRQVPGTVPRATEKWDLSSREQVSALELRRCITCTNATDLAELVMGYGAYPNHS